jgi:hypothetical protein
MRKPDFIKTVEQTLTNEVSAFDFLKRFDTIDETKLKKEIENYFNETKLSVNDFKVFLNSSRSILSSIKDPNAVKYIAIIDRILSKI